MSLDVTLSVEGEEVYWANITHNLHAMAVEGGIYDIVWEPEDNGVRCAFYLIDPLHRAIADMKAQPERFKKHNASNGWGLYKHWVPWVEKYLEACVTWPEATICTHR